MTKPKVAASIRSATLAILILLTAVAEATARSGRHVKNSTSCAAFTKSADGSWHVGTATTLRIGRFKKITLQNPSIGPHFFTFDRTDLYQFLETNCAHARPSSGEQLEILRTEGCMQVQGFLFSKAVPAAEIPFLLQRLQPQIRAA